jgi:hypothetical protein
MNNEAQAFVTQTREHIEKQKEFVENSTWSFEKSRKKRQSKHDVVYKVVKSSLDRLKYFINLIEDHERKQKRVQTFIDLILTLKDFYLKQSKDYFTLEDWTQYPSIMKDDEDVEKHQEEEIEFQDTILMNINKINVDIDKLNLDDIIKQVNVPIFGDKVAPLLMRASFIDRFPEIPKYIEQNGLNDVFDKQ